MGGLNHKRTGKEELKQLFFNIHAGRETQALGCRSLYNKAAAGHVNNNDGGGERVSYGRNDGLMAGRRSGQ